MLLKKDVSLVERPFFLLSTLTIEKSKTDLIRRKKALLTFYESGSMARGMIYNIAVIQCFFGVKMKPEQIAIDGTAGAGKSTLGERLARRLGYLYIDTGAMYRAVTWLALSRDVDIDDGPALARLARQATIEISRPHIDDGRQYTVTVNRRDITWDLRDVRVTRSVASASRHPQVRTLLIEQQRAIARRGGVVMVGRDIGTVVLPTAECKLFLDASPEERARRRYLEIAQHAREFGSNILTLEEILQDIMRRDELDRANMKPADDAIFIVTDHYDALQLLEYVYGLLQSLPARDRVPSKAGTKM